MAERSRSRSSTDPAQVIVPAYYVTGTLQHGYNADPNPLPSATQAGAWSTETCIDWNNGNFPKRCKSGEVICTPFYNKKVTETARPVGTFEHVFYQPNGTWCSTHNQYHNLYYKYKARSAIMSNGTAGGYLAPSSRASMRQAVIDLALTQAYANVDGSEMLAYTTVAESRKTVESVRAILWRAYKILKKVRKLDLAGLSKELKPKELADRYMEARYAIRPLVYDVHNIVNALNRERKYERRTFRGTASDSDSGTSTVNGVGSIYLTKIDVVRSYEYTVSARAGVLADIDVSNVTVLGLDQLAESVWELVPFSFIADWFANVGDYIAAHTPNAGVTQRASWVTVKETLIQTLQVVNHYSVADTSGYVKVSLASPLGTMRREELVLERLASPELCTYPRFDLNLDMYKLTDLGIILRNVLR